MTSAPAGTVQSSGSFSQPSGRATGAGEPCRPRGPVAASGKGTLPSSRSSSVSSSSSVLTSASARRNSEPGREAVQIPGDVLADVAHALVLAEMRGEQLRRAGARCRRPRRASAGWGRTAGERGRQLGEQPGPAQASAADHDAVAPGRWPSWPARRWRRRCRRCRAPESFAPAA